MVGAGVQLELEPPGDALLQQQLVEPPGSDVRGDLVPGPVGDQQAGCVDFLVASAQDVLAAKDGVVGWGLARSFSCVPWMAAQLVKVRGSLLYLATSVELRERYERSVIRGVCRWYLGGRGPSGAESRWQWR